eukprot:CAMPEP_0119145966 /NCGR_PEP_ID=MMETSP1310-20130426/38247_1 /TAXON_ID=464262 /ORGANISM="Genus nov. species nov., Strain RCC2339" /LENGTH=122 /DNA_ID=CAMNT_0007137823 /DNA_START=250 /DNA_END=615 /DNA_ORIENTATION=+
MELGRVEAMAERSTGAPLVLGNAWEWPEELQGLVLRAAYNCFWAGRWLPYCVNVIGGESLEVPAGQPLTYDVWVDAMERAYAGHAASVSSVRLGVAIAVTTHARCGVSKVAQAQARAHWIYL